MYATWGTAVNRTTGLLETFVAALEGGLPMVNVPIGMDQLENAGRCSEPRLRSQCAGSVERWLHVHRLKFAEE